MLNRVTITKYRGFDSFEICDLARVNLLVGKNNCGKTALLECIHFLASGGDPTVLADAARRRGEVVFGGRDEPTFLDISHFFFGHDLVPNCKFALASDNGLSPVTVEAVSLNDVEPSPQLFDSSPNVRPSFAMKITGGRLKQKANRTFFLSEEGALLADLRRPPRRYLGEDRKGGPPIVFITPDSIASESLGGMWNQVLRDKQESDVRQAMSILERDLEDIVFQTGEAMYRYYPGRSGILVSFKGDRRRVPLGSMGDGMRRLLALSISLIHAKGGYLLIDEIDTGLHYSVMADMWELVVKTAVSTNIQVFATSHSYDCIRGLATLCDRDPLLGREVGLQKIERQLAKSASFSGNEISTAIAQEIEVR